MVVNDILIPLSYILLRIGYNCDDLIRFSSFDTSFLGTKGSLRALVGKNVFLIALSSSQKQPSSYLHNINAEVIGFYIDYPLNKIISQKVRKYQKCSESFVEVQKRSQKSRKQYIRSHHRSSESIIEVKKMSQNLRLHLPPPPPDYLLGCVSCCPSFEFSVLCVLLFLCKTGALQDFICFNWDESWVVILRCQGHQKDFFPVFQQYQRSKHIIVVIGIDIDYYPLSLKR